MSLRTIMRLYRLLQDVISDPDLDVRHVFLALALFKLDQLDESEQVNHFFYIQK